MACDCEKKILPHTVRDSGVPLYLQGWSRLHGLGQDDTPTVDESGMPLNPPVEYGPPAPVDIPTVDASGMPLNPPVVYGPPAPGQPGSGVSPNPVTPGTYAGAPSFLTSLAQMFGPKPSYGLPPGPSPRVSSTPYGSTSFGSSLAQYLPIIAVLGIGGLVLSSIGGRRR